MRTLLVDNHDSYTYNVFHLLAAARGEEPVVVNNDAVSWRVLSRSDFDAIVLSPGPGRPERWHDFGVCRDILRYSEIPVLGICLGHQGIGNLLDGNVSSAPMAMHGRLSHVRHSDGGIFEGIPQDFSVVRYHSLAITGLGAGRPRHRLGRRRRGDGDRTPPAGRSGASSSTPSRSPPSTAPRSPRTSTPGAACARTPRWRGAKAPARGRRRAARVRRSRSGAGEMRLRLRAIEGEPPTEALFERLFADAENAFWLDSADAPTRLAQCSYLGTSAGADRCLLEYDVEAGAVAITRARGDDRRARLDLRPARPRTRQARGRAAAGAAARADRRLRRLPRLRAQGRLRLAQRAPLRHAGRGDDARQPRRRRRPRASGRTWSRSAAGTRPRPSAGSTRPRRRSPRRSPTRPSPPCRRPTTARATAHVSFQCGRGREQYLADIARSQAELAAGESYEVCLTDQFSTDASPDPFVLYRHLRRSNPAPFAAYLKFGELAVVSSSPERFLSVDRDRRVEARPIKGTISRSDDPVVDAALRAELTEDEKTKAEHLMIVDLLRNDLGRVCDVDSVSVPELMVVEPYATVHQMVSTISGVLEADRSAVECVHACFPGGSMTGAPKLRTMEIIDDIEDEARGVYSGAIGYFGLDGSTDLSIVIRTIVMRPGRTTIGAGGAIVMQSDPVDEFDEILLKARAPMAAVAADRHRQRARPTPGASSWSRLLEAAEGSMSEPASDACPGRHERAGGDRAGDDPRRRPTEDVAAVAAAVEELLVELGGERPAAARAGGGRAALAATAASGALLVAEAGGERRRRARASWQRALHVPGRYATIQDLWVDPEWRSRAVGAALVDALAGLCEARGWRGSRSGCRGRASTRSAPPRPSTPATASSTSGRGCGGCCHERAADGRAAPRQRRRAPTGSAKAAQTPGQDSNRRLDELRTGLVRHARRAGRAPPTPTTRHGERTLRAMHEPELPRRPARRRRRGAGGDAGARPARAGARHPGQLRPRRRRPRGRAHGDHRGRAAARRRPLHLRASAARPATTPAPTSSAATATSTTPPPRCGRCARRA